MSSTGISLCSTVGLPIRRLFRPGSGYIAGIGAVPSILGDQGAVNKQYQQRSPNEEDG
jgi:hypothetical protein